MATHGDVGRSAGGMRVNPPGRPGFRRRRWRVIVRALRLAPLALIALGRVAAADDAGCFVLTLGRDTTSIECYRRTSARLEVEQVDRTGVLRRRFTYDLAGDLVSHVALVVTSPGRPDTVQGIDATFAGDSAHAWLREGDAPPRDVPAAVPAGAIVVSYNCPWSVYETAIARLVRAGSDSLRLPLHVLGSRGATWLSLHRLGRDSVDLLNHHQDHFHVRIDEAGHVLGALPISGPGKFTVSRAGPLDLGAYTAAWAAREKAGQGLGILSPRDSVTANAGGASLWLDYSRPAKRGRVIFGGVVPYGELWRTGANAATQLRTDRALDFGGTVVPPGAYSLWTVPGPTGWKLVVNGETGQWGTSHDASRDLYTIAMNVSALPAAVERFTIRIEPGPRGGTLQFDWDTTRASAAFTVEPAAPEGKR